MAEQGINFVVTADNRNFIEGVNQVQQRVNTLTSSVQASGADIDETFNSVGDTMKRVAQLAGVAFTLDSAKDFITQCIKVRGEIQALETSFTTLLGSRAKADALIGDIRQFAATTPMDVGTLAKGAQTMLGFNIELQKVMPIMKAIGDISMGDAQKFGSLTLAFSQASATGKLMGQDLLQMINAGFNPLVQMSKETGKSITQLKDDMSNGKISVQMLTDAFINATAEGGQFNGMLESQSHTLQGAFSNLSGAFEDMLNEIGEKGQDVVVDVVNGMMNMVQNYEKVGKTIAELIALYGTYKAALVTVTAVQTTRAAMQAGWTLAELAHYRALLLVEKAQKLLNATMLANPYVRMAAVITMVVGAVYKLATAETDAERAAAELADRYSEMQTQMQLEQDNIDLLFNSLRKAKEGTDEYNEAKSKILEQYGDYLKGLVNEKGELLNIEEAYLRVSAAAKESANARAMADARNSAQDTYATSHKDVVDEIQKTLKDNISNANFRNTLMQLIMRDLSKEHLSVEVQNMLGDAFGETRLKNGNWRGDSNVADILKQFKSERAALKLRNETIKEAEATFTTYANDYKDKSDAELTALTESIRHHIKEAKDFGDKQVEVFSNGSLFKSYENAAEALLEVQQMEVELERRKTAAEAGKGNTGSNTPELTEAEKKKLEQEAKRRKAAAEQIAKEMTDIEIQNQQAEIELMKEGSAKRIAQIELDFTKQKVAIDRQAAELRKKNKESGGNSELTAEQEAALNTSLEYARKAYEQAITEEQRAQSASMLEYLKTYGNFQEQKYAIAKEYAEKIRTAEEAGDDWEVKRLTRERDSKLNNVNAQAINADIDWRATFGSLAGVLQEQIKQTLGALKDYTKTDTFAGSNAEDKKTIYEAIERLQNEAQGGKGTLDFNTLSAQFKALGERISDVTLAQHNAEVAQIALSSAQENYNRALVNGTDAEKAAAKAQLNTAQAVATSTRNAYDQAANNLREMSDDYAAAIKDTNAGLTGIASGLQKFKSGSLEQAYEGLKSTITGLTKLNIPGKVGDAIGKLSSALGNSGFIGQILGAVLSLFDVLKDGIGTIISSLIDTIFDAVVGIIKNVITGKFVEQIFGSLVDGVSSLLNTVTFGGFNALFKTAGNSREVNEFTKKLTDSNDRLRESIDKLKDEIGASSGWRAVQSAEDAKQVQSDITKNTLDILMAQMGYHGVHHSNAYYWGLNAADYNSLNATLAEYAKRNNTSQKSVRNLEDIYTLTPEEMDYIRTHNLEMWTKMLDQGKYDKSEYWNAFADQAGLLDEITAALKESLTQTTFDSLRDSFVDALMDMDTDAADFANNFSEMLMRAVLNAQISNLLDEELKRFYDRWATLSEDGLTDTEVDELRQMYNAIVAEGEKIRDEAALLTGYTGNSTYSQQASTGYSAEMSEETGAEMVGRLTALTEAMYANVDGIEEANTTLGGIHSLAVIRNSILDSIENNIGLVTTQLTTIAKNTGELFAINTALGKIEKSLKNL